MAKGRELIISLPDDEKKIRFFREIEEFAGRTAKEIGLEEPMLEFASESVCGVPVAMTITFEDDDDYD
jgi:hypothetical protein